MRPFHISAHSLLSFKDSGLSVMDFASCFAHPAQKMESPLLGEESNEKAGMRAPDTVKLCRVSELLMFHESAVLVKLSGFWQPGLVFVLKCV